MKYPLIAQIGFDKDLRWLLVGMLFALVIGEIAAQAARLVAAVKVFKPFANGKAWDVWAIISHLILVTGVVTTSWIGWSISLRNERHHAHYLQSVFSWPYVLLLIDVAILICYFLMIRSVIIPKEVWTFVPSAREDSFFLVIIFLGYFFWGLVNHLCLHGGTEFWMHAWPTMVGCGLTLLVWFVIRNRKGAGAAICVDVFLLAIVFSYRYVKLALAIAAEKMSGPAVELML